jgi:tetratricopeptide (TPR) repeat protein
MISQRILIIFMTFILTLIFPPFSICQQDDQVTVEALNQQVTMLFQQGRYEDAIPLAQKAADLVEKTFGPEHPNLAFCLNNLAKLYRSLGDYAKAEPLYQRSLAIYEKSLGPDDPNVGASLNNLAMLYVNKGDYAKAELLYQRSLAIYEKAFGPDHPYVANSLNNLAALYVSLEDYTRAEPLYRRSLAIREKSLGPEHPDVAASLNSLADLYESLDDYAQAEPLFQRSLAIREKALGPEHTDVALSLNNLALLYVNKGDYARAEPLYQRALAIYEKALGPDDPEVATSLNNIAMLYDSLGDYTKAESLYKRSLAIREKAFGSWHPDVANSLNNLASLYRAMGDYTRAEPLYQRTLAIREKTLGPENTDVATTLNNLAGLYQSLDDYAKAEPLYQRALVIMEKSLGPEHTNVANCLNNIAFLYVNIGDYAKAEPLYQHALAIREKALGPDHPDVANSLNNLAGLYRSSGDYAKAESLYKRALAIIEKAFGPDHLYAATILNNLAGLYDFYLGDYTKAEPLYKRALAIREKALGHEHTDVASSLNNLAGLYRTLGDYAKAEPLYQRSLAIYEKALGPEHSYVAACLNNIALLCAASDDFTKSRAMFVKAQHIDDKLIDQVMGFTSEDQKMKFLSLKRSNLYRFMSLVDQYLSSDPSAGKDALDVWLRRKGIILETQKRYQEALLYSDDTEAIKTFQDLAGIRARLSMLVFGGPGKEGAGAYKKRMDDLETQKEKLEARLSQLSQAYAVQKKAAKANSDQIAGVLPENTVLLEFARIEMYNFKVTGNEVRTLPSRYIAFLLYAGKEGRVGIVDLGDASKIDEAVAKFKGEMSNIKDINGIKALASSRSVYDLVFAPIRTALGEVKEIFVSPDGNLNLIPFEVLQGPDGRFLIEDYTFNYLSAGRDILGFGQTEGKGNKVLLMGDPDFDAGTDEKGLALRKEDTKEREDTKRSMDMNGLHFTRLPGTREEVQAIQMLLGKGKADLYTGNEALEDILRQQSKPPSILHLATHGFFLNDLDLSNLTDDSSDRGIQKISVAPKATGKKVKIENPLLRSGVALAGANNSLKLEDTGKSDGIVTAEKILGLRLRGTDMVVLSACETGLGEVNNGEGVFGLCRAFTQAGARSLVMSMWSVPDKETKELMVEFYRNIQSGKMNRCQALRQAELNQIKTVKGRYGDANPFYWGAFVFLGEP